MKNGVATTAMAANNNSLPTGQPSTSWARFWPCRFRPLCVSVGNEWTLDSQSPQVFITSAAPAFAEWLGKPAAVFTFLFRLLWGNASVLREIGEPTIFQHVTSTTQPLDIFR